MQEFQTLCLSNASARRTSPASNFKFSFNFLNDELRRRLGYQREGRHVHVHAVQHLLSVNSFGPKLKESVCNTIYHLLGPRPCSTSVS